MTEWIWFNGRKLPMSEAHLSVEDRGFQFADGVYEVIKLYGGEPFALDEHLARLSRSAAGIQLNLPLTPAALGRQINDFLADIHAGEGMVYLQLTRGASPRNHLFPEVSRAGSVEPTLLFYFRPLPALPAPGKAPGVKLITLPDDRWQRCWIKSIALLPNVLAKNAAVAQGADEAVFIDNGNVTECAASNIFAFIRGELVTHPIGPKVLPGVTRQLLLKLATEMDIPVRERTWSEAEALSAEELFITSTTREISWVARWNDKPTKCAACGPQTLRLHTALSEYVLKSLGAASA